VIRALLLDFGGVCLLSPVELHGYLEELYDLPSGTFDWRGPLDPSTDALYRTMIAGDGLTERGYWGQRAAEVGEVIAGRPMTIAEYARVLFDPPRPEVIRPEATAVVQRALAAGFGVSVLTNDLSAFHGPDWAAGVPFLSLVDHLVDCSDTGFLKPDPRAYQRAVDAVGVPAEEMLFVDDQPLNAAGAEAFGMQVQFFDIADATGSWAKVAQRIGV
jgi:putative hydrolase of the HAD superfamily